MAVHQDLTALGEAGHAPAAVTLDLFIDGAWLPPSSGRRFDVVNPVDAQVMASAALASVAEAARAVEAADRAFGTWSRTTGDERAKVLRAAAAAVSARSEELATVLTREHGKPLADARKEIKAAIDTFDFYAEEARRIGGELAPSRSRTARSLVLRQPVGVVAAITPWNYPVSLMAWKLGPALAAGCTVVVKPSSAAPVACAIVAGIVGEIAPRGVVNVVTGEASVVGDELVRNPLTRMIAFTGSTATGQELMRAAAADLKHVLLELGGQTPFVVFKDADLDLAVKDGVKRAFRNNGQICNAVNRIYVEEEVAAEYVDRFVKETASITIGDGLANPTVDLGPMIDQKGLDRTQRHVDDAVAKGATVLCGGGRAAVPGSPDGFFFQPTVLTNVTPDMLVMHEETFGPVVGIATFKGLDDAVSLANSTEFGLVTYAYTSDLRTAFGFGERVESGTVAINTVSPDSLLAPYPAWKHSGIGLELGHQGLEEYLHVKHLLLELV